MPQIPLKFEDTQDFSSENFFVSESNIDAFSYIENSWNSHCIVIYGPPMCGKTHLCHIWREKSDAIFLSEDEIDSAIYSNHKCFIVEDISSVNEDKLFHIFNHTKEIGGALLLTSVFHQSKLDLKLPDLISRLNSIPAISVSEPDSELLKTIMLKLFSDRQIAVGVDVIDFLVKRIERSFFAAEKTVALLDELSMQEKRKITIPFVKHSGLFGSDFL